ncbi:MAG: hypothetical protein COT22_08025 [Ignavibacteria bacterium CG08_land_8_20_14_0_20_37_9]|nr:MAG: hypothetical protein COT22_08025 [Ignavibacteria bacterium CG08_land_8_20_14_0_20_37_9]
MCKAGTISLLKTELYFRSEKIFRKGNSFNYKELQVKLYLTFTKKMDFFTEKFLWVYVVYSG